jgi:hypothetical protein
MVDAKTAKATHDTTLDGRITSTKRASTARELLEVLRETGVLGMWKDRTDIGDSTEFARQLRRLAETRDASR